MEAPAHQFTVEATRREDPHEEPRRQQWRAGAEREHPSRRQRVRKSFLLVLVFSATVFAILRRALSLSFRKGSDVPQAPGTGGDIMYGEDGMPFHYINSEDLFPNTQHPQTRMLLVEVLRFAWESQRASKGFSARFLATDENGVQLQVDARLQEEGEDWHIDDATAMLAGYLESAVDGCVSEALDGGGASSERVFSIFSVVGSGRIDFTIQATATRGRGGAQAEHVKQRKRAGTGIRTAVIIRPPNTE
ncbi:hypothetical protein, conserved [Eimeria maxima]|uniref:Uncharacterized protein n=1 Tax=Eimeria maxima TaxID=5804 RepID=U6LYB6_EIMMA|nr:hypothetical protein, conserved [Eimeria maxima]CDJ56731.1 hypothetical protein, conserved [Eimeria maxima]